MQVRFRLPPAVDSPLARLDPRWRLAALLVVIAACVAVHRPPHAVAAVGLAAVLTLLARVPPGWLLERLAALSVLLALFVVPMPLLSGVPWSEAAAVALRALSVALVTAVLIVSGPLERTARAARSLGIPGVVVHVGLLAYRYLFLLGDELDRLRVALRVRGFRNRPNRHSYNTIAAATGTLFVRGAERADRVAAAMRCRGFDGSFRSLEQDHTRPADVLAFAVLLAVSVALVWHDRG